MTNTVQITSEEALLLMGVIKGYGYTLGSGTLNSLEFRGMISFVLSDHPKADSKQVTLDKIDSLYYKLEESIE